MEPVQEEITETEEKVLPKKAQTSSVTFDTAEIFGLEEKLLDALNSPEIREEPVPIEPIAIDSSFFEKGKEEAPVLKEPKATDSKPPLEIPVTETPAKVPASEPLTQEPMLAAEPILEAPKAAEPEYPVEAPISEAPMTTMPEYPVKAPISEVPKAAEPEYPEEASISEAPETAVSEYPVETAASEALKAAEPEYSVKAPAMEAPIVTAPIAAEPESPAEALKPVEPVSAAALERPIEIPIPDEEAPAPDVSVGKPVDLKARMPFRHLCQRMKSLLVL